MTDYIYTKKDDRISVINLSAAKKIYCKDDIEEETGVENLCLYADEEFIFKINKNILNEYIKKDILNKKLIYKYFEINYIERVICSDHIKQIKKYGYKEVDSIIDSIIENKDVVDVLFRIYKANFVGRFMVVYKRRQSYGEPLLMSDIFINILFGNLVRLALKELEKEEEEN